MTTGGEAVLKLRWFRIRKILCRSAKVGVGVAELGIGKSATGVVGVQRLESQGQVGVKLAFQSSEGWIDVWGESGQWLCCVEDSRH